MKGFLAMCDVAFGNHTRQYTQKIKMGGESFSQEERSPFQK